MMNKKKSEKITHVIEQVRDIFKAKRVPHIFIADKGDGSVCASHAGSYIQQVALAATFIKGLTDYLKIDPKEFLTDIVLTLEHYDKSSGKEPKND